jgi:hypothetical protein
MRESIFNWPKSVYHVFHAQKWRNEDSFISNEGTIIPLLLPRDMPTLHHWQTCELGCSYCFVVWELNQRLGSMGRGVTSVFVKFCGFNPLVPRTPVGPPNNNLIELGNFVSILHDFKHCILIRDLYWMYEVVVDDIYAILNKLQAYLMACPICLSYPSSQH